MSANSRGTGVLADTSVKNAFFGVLPFYEYFIFFFKITFNFNRNELREEQALISANNMKPVVKLLINRHNNKYSYTGARDVYSSLFSSPWVRGRI